MAAKNSIKKVNQDPLLSALGDLKELFPDLADEKVLNESSSTNKEIVDIITFCEHPRLLGLPDANLPLFPAQKIILKTFYMGDIGNENLRLNQEEWEWLYATKDKQNYEEDVYENNLNVVIEKIKRKESKEDADPFSLLQLVLGRRSGKCREENDIIATTEGSITFGELLIRLQNNEKIGICTYDQKEWKRTTTYDIKAEDNGIVDCYTIETESGIKETSSHNHPYLVLKDNYGYNPFFVDMENLCIGDRVAVASCTELFGCERIGKDAAYLLGLNSHEEIPNDILCGSKEEVSAFLTSFLNNNNIYTTKYEKVATQVKHLFQKFGIHVKTTTSEAEIYPGKYSKWYTINIPMSVDLKNIDTVFSNKFIQFEEIKSIKPVGQKRTVALEVAGTNVIGGDLISHNTLLASVITAYEVYKLLSINAGDPHSYYGLPVGDVISILNVALSQDQAGLLFTAIAARLRNSPFFKDRIAGASADAIRLFTNKDLEMKAKSSTLKVNGSIELICGHSNPDTLRGRNAIMILFDEIAFFDEKGKVSGTKFYDDLKPSVARFYKHKAAKIVMISSPNAKSGIFHDIFQSSKEDKKTLSFQLPTWLVNLDLSYENADIQIDKKRNPDNFAKEYGAQFSASSNYGNFFEEILIDKCVNHNAGPHANPDRKMNYYLHVDPANGTNNYAAVLIGKERYTNRIGHKRNKCHLAGIWIWKPGEMGLLFHNIDKDVLAICQKFRPMSVTYDSYQSVQSLQFLKSHGVPATELRFGRDNKMKLYQNLLDLMAYEYGPELVLYDDGSANAYLLIQELKNLRKKKTQRGWTITPDKDAEVKTDDLCVHPDTFVFTDTPKRIKDVEIGEYIFTHNGIYSKILAKKEHTDFKKIVELCPRLCLPLVATDNHPVEVYNIHSKQRAWKPIMDLDIDNDMIVRSIDKSETPFTIDLAKYASLIVPKHCGINDYISDKKIKDRNANAKWHNRFLESNYDSGYLFGLYLAEGSIHDHGISFAANFNEKKIHKNLSKYTNSVFGLNDTGHKKQKASNGSQSGINSQIVKKLFMDLFGGKTAGEKFIPKIMTNANFDFQKGILNGLWDGDGCYSKSKNAFVYTTTSEAMAVQISAMLLRFGIISSMNRIKRKGRTTRIRERSFKFNYDLFNIFVFNSESFNNLAHILNGYSVSPKKQSKFHKPMAVIEEGFAAYKIREILAGDSQTVVNLTVENCHSYVSGFVNSHNCDCLAGACSSANDVLRPALPEPTTVRLRF